MGSQAIVAKYVPQHNAAFESTSNNNTVFGAVFDDEYVPRVYSRAAASSKCQFVFAAAAPLVS